MEKNQKELWDTYVQSERSVVEPLITSLGFELADEQPHVAGERFLMQAVTTESGKKIILVGTRTHDQKRVIIKSTSDQNGIREIEKERARRKLLQKINFAYEIFLSPEELLFIKQNKTAVSIQSFIEQESTFLARPTREQFTLALKAFKAQESAHATTYEHSGKIKKTFGSMDAAQYRTAYKEFTKNILGVFPTDQALKEALSDGYEFLSSYMEILEQYCGFLTHTDFVPHNFRISGEDIYLLDYSSLRFGNKYEGWARFLNFMALYNPELEHALVEYVRLNRTPEELVSLKIMRVHRLAEIIWYHSRNLEKSSGDLRVLNAARVHFWKDVLQSQLSNTSLPEKVRTDYRALRDSLRSDDEKMRQKDLH